MFRIYLLLDSMKILFKLHIQEDSSKSKIIFFRVLVSEHFSNVKGSN